MADNNAEVAFDKDQYDRLRTVVNDVATTTQDALWNSDGYSIGPDLRAQPVEATWGAASQVGNSVNKLAAQVRAYTDTLCGKALPEYSDSVGKAAESLDELDNTTASTAGGN